MNKTFKMKFMIKEEINRIKNLMLVNEENEMGQYMDSTYLKTSEPKSSSLSETILKVKFAIN